MTKPKKIFISYSWKPENNKKIVVKLAERLTNDGIHVILDDWDLKEGQDKLHFMERMVNDDSVNKVLLICNKEYTSKANKRKDGVGTESLIISGEIYNQVDQTKFLPVVMEYDPEGKPFLPTFVKTRIYFDLSSEQSFEDNYDKLLRNIYDKPASKRPPIGKMPVHLENNNPIFLPTAHKIARIKSSLINESGNSPLLVKEYLQTFIDSLLLFKIDPEKDKIDGDNFIKKVELSIEKLQALKLDFLEFLDTIFKFSNDNFDSLLLEFFEGLLQFYQDNEIRLETGSGLQSLLNDNYRFFNYDLFLNFITVLMKFEKFSTLNYIYSNPLVVINNNSGKAEAMNFVLFRKFNITLNEEKNKSLNPKRVSIVADLIKKHSASIKFDDIVRSDILTYYMSLIYPCEWGFSPNWYPETSCYSSWYFQLFPKMISKRYFEKIKPLFNVEDIEAFKSLIIPLAEKEKIHNGFFNIPKIDVGLNLDSIGTIG